MQARRCLGLGGKMVQGVLSKHVKSRAGSKADRWVHSSQSDIGSLDTRAVPALHWVMQARRMSCCANLGNPAPRELIVEYCEESDLTDYFIELADKVENAHPEIAVLSSPDNSKARKGSFEVTSGDRLLFSKLKTKRLPKFEDILNAIADLEECELEAAAVKTARG